MRIQTNPCTEPRAFWPGCDVEAGIVRNAGCTSALVRLVPEGTPRKVKKFLRRRDLLKAAPAGAVLLCQAAQQTATTKPQERIRLEPFDYRGVRLLKSRWLDQVQAAPDYYFALSDNDILHGFRDEADLLAPGRPLGGWCEKDSAPVFGQWISGMARLSRATGDAALHFKAAYLVSEWATTVKADGDCRMRHYTWEAPLLKASPTRARPIPRFAPVIKIVLFLQVERNDTLHCGREER